MKYLLDTHTFLWFLFDDNKLSEKVKKIIANTSNRIYVSSISYFEISLKYSTGKLVLGGILPEQLTNAAKLAGIVTLKLSEDEASSFYKLPKLKHKDPFDRMIIWQTITNNMSLISKDKFF